MKKKILILFTLIVSIFLLVGCGKTTPDKDKDKDPVAQTDNIIDFSKQLTKPVTITIWSDDENGSFMFDLIQAFNQKHPNIVVKHQHMGNVDSREQLKTRGPSGNGADIIQFPHDHISSAVLEDLLFPLNTETVDLINQRVNPLSAKSGQFKGKNDTSAKQYALPIQSEALVLFYNKSLIETPDTTMEAILTKAKAFQEEKHNGIKNKDAGNKYLGLGSHWADSYFMQAFYSAFGYQPFGPESNDPTNVGFDSQELTKALEYLRTEVYTKNGLPVGDKSDVTQFTDGITPYLITGPWAVAALKEKLGDKLGATKLPSIKVNNVDIPMKPFAGNILTAVYKNTKHTLEAMKFLQFLLSDEAMLIQYQHTGKTPSLKADLISKINDKNLQEDPYVKIVSAQAAVSTPMPQIPEVSKYWGPGQTMLTTLYTNKSETIKKIQEDAQKSFNALISAGN